MRDEDSNQQQPPPVDRNEPLKQSEEPTLETRDLDPALSAGSRVGPYQILGEIGRGGMGVVYQAVRADDEYRKRVAIKLIPGGMDADFILARFRRERQILASLEHPNICRLLDGGTNADGRPYFVMEFIEGLPIDKYCDNGKLSTTERLKLFRQVCSAVQYAHQNLIVHRDLKPGNILVASGGVPKLLDFGIAKLMNPDLYPDVAAQTLAMARVMTPDYASPEQIRGLPVTTASDVYSLGVLLYELLTGRRPYQTNRALGFQERERVICEQDPEKPSKVVTQPELISGPPGAASQSLSVEQISQMREGAPDKLRRRLAGDLDNIVLMAMRKEPQRRYASVDQFSEDIRRHLEGLPVLARKDTPGYRISKFIARNKAGVAAVTLILLTMIVGTVTTMREAHVAERRFQDVRKLANSVVFELHDAIQNLPGSTAARKLLVERALEYLDRLSQEVGTDRSLQLELAAAYQKVGDVQGNPGNANLGDAKAALQSYRKALAIRKNVASAVPQDWQAQAALASSYASLGGMSENTTEAMDNLQKAASIYFNLVQAHPSEIRILEQLTNTLISIGVMQWNMGNSTRALSSYVKGRETLEELALAEPANMNTQKRLTSIYNRIGFALSDSGDPGAALENFEKGRIIRERLAAADPINATLQRELWVSYNAIADVLGNPNLQNLGRPREALDYYRKALAIAEILAAADSSNIRARRDIVLSLTRIADVLQISGDLPGALSNYRQSLTLIEALQIANPLNDGLRRDQGIGFERLARALAASGDNKGALDYFNRALSLQQKLAEADPKSARGRQDWLDTLYNTGDFLLKTRNLEAAGEHFRRGCQEAEKLLAANQSNVEARRTLANFSDKLGDLHNVLAADKGTPLDQQQSHRQEANALYRKAVELVKEIQTVGKLTAEDKKSLQELTRKLSLSSTPTPATDKGLSQH